MVHGKCCGSFHLVAPVATNSCGTFFESMYFWIAVLPGVPSGLKIGSTSSDSTSLRACSTLRRRVAVIIGDEVDFSPVDAACGVDLVEIGLLGLADHAIGGSRSRIGHDVPDLDLGVGGARVVFAQARRCSKQQAAQARPKRQPDVWR